RLKRWSSFECPLFPPPERRSNKARCGLRKRARDGRATSLAISSAAYASGACPADAARSPSLASTSKSGPDPHGGNRNPRGYNAPMEFRHIEPPQERGESRYVGS